MELSQRVGYGAAFNNLTLNDGKLVKEAKNGYGKAKLDKELGFYQFLQKRNLSLSFPKILDISDTSFVMPFYKDFVPFHTIFWKFPSEKQHVYIEKIRKELDTLHASYTSPVSQDSLRVDLYEEGFAKVLRRYDEVRDILSHYDIEQVNGVTILSFERLMEYIHEKILAAGQTLPPEYCLIHGDCQFSNLLYSQKDDSFLFVDPRGYFGKTDILGLPHYDSAKLLFALTGYDVFDSLLIDTLEIQEKNLILPPIPILYETIQKVTFETILMISIWLGNAHCFKQTPAKAALSHFYARYIGTLVYISDRL